ncbi:MAG TPA: class I SAM-dependent methyltransferase [Candidatus Sphingomonas excrementigallinarum]|nr:class I SAM-dependent methyltransferase [Candidatus Sphingomonas excrementigallinarum]
MTTDTSEGWDAVAKTFMAVRSEVGANIVRRWAMDAFPPSTAILDLGCGSGMPIARALVDEGFSVWGIDASSSLLAAYRAHFPDMPALCEPVQGSELFGRRFAGVVAIGLIFLLAEPDQDRLLEKVAKVLEPGGRFLFSAPHQRCEWRDSLTGRVSRSLGASAYAERLQACGLVLADRLTDEGQNHYYDAVKPG